MQDKQTHRILYKARSDKGLYPIPQIHPQLSQIHKSPLASSISVMANKDAVNNKAFTLPQTAQGNSRPHNNKALDLPPAAQGNSRPHALLGQQVKTKL